MDNNTTTYLIAWNNGINKEATVHEIVAYKRKQDGAEIN